MAARRILVLAVAARLRNHLVGPDSPTSIDSARIKIIDGKRMIWVATYNTGVNLCTWQVPFSPATRP